MKNLFILFALFGTTSCIAQIDVGGMVKNKVNQRIEQKTNQAIDKTRSREISKEKKTKDIDLHVNKIDRSEYVEQKIEGIGVQEVLKSLSEEQRFVVEYLYFKGYTQSELADESGIPLGTVKTRLRAAMQQLRALVGTT